MVVDAQQCALFDVVSGCCDTRCGTTWRTSASAAPAKATHCNLHQLGWLGQGPALVTEANCFLGALTPQRRSVLQLVELLAPAELRPLGRSGGAAASVSCMMCSGRHHSLLQALVSAWWPRAAGIAEYDGLLFANSPFIVLVLCRQVIGSLHPIDAVFACRMATTRADLSLAQGPRSRGHPGLRHWQQARCCKDGGPGWAKGWLPGVLATNHVCALV